MNNHHLNNIKPLFDKYVKEQKVAGVNLLVFKDNKEVCYFEEGMANVEKNIPFARNTICRLFSMSKPITSVAAMILLEQGKIDLAEEVGRYIPEFWNLQVCTEGGRNGKSHKASRNVTIQDLLNMTSGYTYGAWWEGAPLGEHLTTDLINELNEDVCKNNQITTMEVAKRLAAIPVNFEPGTDYQYGLSADILGAVIEVASGMKFSEFLKKNIFDPLAMEDTAFYIPEEKMNRFAQAYEEISGKNMKLFTSPNLGISPCINVPPAFESGGAGLYSTVDDYMKFVCMLVNGGELNGKRILKQKTVEFMTKARLRSDVQQHFNEKMEHLSGYTYCNLVRVAYEPGKCKAITEEGEFGWDGWLGPYMSVDVKNKLGIVMMMQKVNSGTWDLTRKMKNIVYTAL